MTPDEIRSVHKRWIAKYGAAGPTPYDKPPDPAVRTLYEDCRQCGRCAFYVPVTSHLGSDWGACANPASAFDCRLVFEHHTCVAFEGR